VGYVVVLYFPLLFWCLISWPIPNRLSCQHTHTHTHTDAFKHRKDYQEIRQRIQTDKSFAKDLYTENSKAAQVARQSKQEVDADEELARKLYEEHMNEINSHKSKSQSDLLADEELARKLAEVRLTPARQ